MNPLLCVRLGALNMLRPLFALCLCVVSVFAQQWEAPDGSGILQEKGVSDDGSVYQIRFLSVDGVGYRLQHSGDLNIWTDGAFYRGMGHTITHPLFPLPQSNESNPAPVIDPEDYVQLINGSFRIQEITINGATTGLLVSWVSLDDEQPKSYVLHGKQIDEDMPPPFYSKNVDEYALFINFMGTITDPNNVPSSDTLGTKDSGLIGKLVEVLPDINAEITANTAAQAAAPPPPPRNDAKQFYRIRRFYMDSDGDGLQDHIEAQQGLNSWNWDSDGDGVSDSLDANPLVNDAVADPDGAGLLSSLDNGLLARYDFEAIQGTFPNQTFEDKSGNGRHAAPFAMGVDTLGMVSKAGKTTIGYAEGDGRTFQGLTSYALSFWVCFDKDSVKGSTAGTIHGLYGVYDYNHYISSNHNHAILEYDLRGLRIEKAADGSELWKLGGFQYDSDSNNDGFAGPVTSTEYETMSFTQSQGSIDDGNWHHIVVVREHPYYRIYIDGVLKKQEAKAVLLLDHTEDTNFCFGRWMEHLPNTQFKGKFDRMRIYGRALSASEVTALHRQDIDNDGLWDISENRSLLWRDTNGDEVRQNSESTYLINPFRWDAPDRDHDEDGATSLAEQNHATYPTDIANPDTDGDLLLDGWELVNGLNPVSTNDANGDANNDGVDNITSYSYTIDPNDPDGDSDNDGTSDAQEIAQGSHPNDARDGGQVIPENERYSILLGVGDKSGSESEDYVLNVFLVDPVTGQEKRYYTVRSGGFGQYKEETKSFFRRGDTYTFQIDWKRTNNHVNPNTASDGPDFDYTFKVEPANGSKTILIDAFNPQTKKEDAALTILGTKNDVTNFREITEKRRVLLLSPWFKVYPKDVPGPDKAHWINLNTRQNEAAFYGEFKKCVSRVWKNQFIVMPNYLEGAKQRFLFDLYKKHLKWKSNGNLVTLFNQPHHELNFVPNPAEDKIEHYDIEVMNDSDEVLDRLIITVVPSETKQNFDDWYNAEKTDLAWLALLPPMFSWIETTVQPDGHLPRPDRNFNPFFYGVPHTINTRYHPNGYYEQRSYATAGNHGHQVCFDDTGLLIVSGVSAGSADKQAPFPAQLDPLKHVNADVKPFVWAAQLDGSPTEADGTNMTAPMMHEGEYLKRYFEVRPAVPNAKPRLTPGATP